MRDYLVFRLYAPLCSWGDIAVGEVRPSWPYPTKSAILGLLAAAKGVRRDQHDDLDGLRAGYGVAVRTLVPGTPLRDYHTIQRPGQEWIGRGKAKRLRTYASRRDELRDGGALNCTQSTRDYYADAVHDVAVWETAHPPLPWTLEDMAADIERPTFCLYLGRKACPPALPLRPRVIRQSPTLRAAFSAASALLAPDPRFLEPLIAEAPASRPPVHVFWDELPDGESGYAEVHRATRRDDPLDRERWQFLERQECYATEPLEDFACT